MARIAYINLSVRPALKAKLEKLAKEDRRSFSSYVKMVLEDHVKARQASSKGVEQIGQANPAQRLTCAAVSERNSWAMLQC
jgi:hypothetical protein